MNQQMVNTRLKPVSEIKMPPPQEKGWYQTDEKLSNFGE
jgi:hypothetical protein